MHRSFATCSSFGSSAPARWRRRPSGRHRLSRWCAEPLSRMTRGSAALRRRRLVRRGFLLTRGLRRGESLCT